MGTQIHKHVSRAVLAGAAGLALVSLAAAPAAAQGAKIGVLFPFTGPLAAFAESNFNGVQVAIDEVNAAGGVLGGDLTFAQADTETNPDAAVAGAQRLINVDGVSAIVGPMASGSTIPVGTSVVNNAHIPLISQSATSPVVTSINDNDFVFRTAPSDAAQGVLLAQLVDSKGIDKVAIISRNDAYANPLSEGFAANFSGEVTLMLQVPPEAQQSYRSELQQLAGSGADWLLVTAFPEEGTIIVRQAIEEGFFSKFIFTDGMKSNQVVEAVGQEFLNESFGTAPISSDQANFSAFRDAYRVKFGTFPSDGTFVENAYDATILLALAIEAAGSTDGTAIRDSLRAVATPPGVIVRPGEFGKAKAALANGEDINYEGATGAVDFDAVGDILGSFGEWTFENGHVVEVKPL